MYVYKKYIFSKKKYTHTHTIKQTIHPNVHIIFGIRMLMSNPGFMTYKL